MCDVPRIKAPNLFAYWPNPEAPEHCYVKRQPESDSELEQMINVIRCAEFQCIRYRGKNRALQTRLIEMGEGHACDDLPHDLHERAEALDEHRHLRSLKDQMRSLKDSVPLRSWLDWARKLWRGRG